MKRDRRAYDRLRNKRPERKAAKQKWSENNRARIDQLHAARHAVRIVSEPLYRLRYLLVAARARAKKLGIAFVLTLSDILAGGSVPKVCQSCQCLLDYTTVSRYRGRQPSLDRFDHTQGYLATNVKVICTRCNSLKNNATVSELRCILSYMERAA